MALLGINTGQFDVGLATKTYVDSEIAGLKDSLDKILEINLVQELTKLYRWKCMNIGDITFDIQIAELERQYRELTGERYQRLDCKDLLELTDG